MQELYPVTESQDLTNRRREDIAWVMHWVGVALLGYFLVGILSAAWPVALLKPAWLATMGANLVSTSMTPLLGTLLVAAATVVDPQSDSIANRAKLVRRLASWAAIGYLLLIPVQLYSGIQLLREQKQEATQLLRKATEAAQAIEKSTTVDELRKAYSLVPGQNRPLPATIPQPLEEVKDRLVDAIRPRIKLLENQFDERMSTYWQKWLADSFANTLRLLLLFVGFAALGRKSSREPTLLENVLSGNFWMPGRPSWGRRRSRRTTAVDIPQEWIAEESPSDGGSSTGS